MSKTKKGTNPAPKTHGNSVPETGQAAQAVSVDESIVEKILAYTHEDYMDKVQRTIYGAVLDAIGEIEAERDRVCADRKLAPWTVEYNETWNNIRNPEYSQYRGQCTSYEAAAVLKFVKQYKKHVPELKEAYRRICADVVDQRREQVKKRLAEYGRTLTDGQNIDAENGRRGVMYYSPAVWAIISSTTEQDVPYARTKAEYDVLTLFSDGALISAIQALTNHIYIALDAAYSERNPGARPVDEFMQFVRAVWDDVLQNKWNLSLSTYYNPAMIALLKMREGHPVPSRDDSLTLQVGYRHPGGKNTESIAVTVSITPDFQELRTLPVTARVLLIYGLHKLTRCTAWRKTAVPDSMDILPASQRRVFIPRDEYAQIRGLKNKKRIAENLKRDADLLVRTCVMMYADVIRKTAAGKTTRDHDVQRKTVIVESYDVVGGSGVQLLFATRFVEMVANSYFLYLPPQLFSLNMQRYGGAFSLGVSIWRYLTMNRTNTAVLSVGMLAEWSPSIPSQNDPLQPSQRKNPTRTFLVKLETELDALAEAGIIDWEYCGPGGEQLTDAKKAQPKTWANMKDGYIRVTGLTELRIK